MIGRWFLVDDNSSVEDREEMKRLWPWIDFYWKSPEEKGHAHSMNIIRREVNSPYILHMEDDWLWIQSRPYISEALEVLGQQSNIGQCLFNKNYAETLRDSQIKGGIEKKTSTGLDWVLHEFCPDGSIEKTQFIDKFGSNVLQCCYWPHFSFRPSLIRRRVFDEIGEFSTTRGHFEMEYAYRYSDRGWLSAFLPGINSLHIGRLTSERHNNPDKLNAYDLNEQGQFSESVKIRVINLDRRPDRFLKFMEGKNKSVDILEWVRVSAIDGSKDLDPGDTQLQRLFDSCDFNMRMGMVGCALSHINLWIKLLYDEGGAGGAGSGWFIVEDDITLVKDFTRKLIRVGKLAIQQGAELVYLGHHLRPQYRVDGGWNSPDGEPVINQWSSDRSLKESMGGTGGYWISQTGARKLLEWIDSRGVTNGIDTIQQKAADVVKTFYAFPHLIYSDCAFEGGPKIDSDIQYNYESLKMKDVDSKGGDIFEDIYEDIYEFRHVINYIFSESDKRQLRFHTKSMQECEKLVKLCDDTAVNCTTVSDGCLYLSKPGDSSRLLIGGKYSLGNILTKKNRK